MENLSNVITAKSNGSQINAPSINALSIDVEEHFHVHAFSHLIKPSDWTHHQSRVVENTQRLLALLRTYNVQATFFVLGWVAERHPELVQEIADDGHEIASHGYSHQLVYEQTEVQFADDIERSLQAITLAVPSVKIRGYRAPSFSITNKTLWAQETLRQYGFQYDSSIFPVAMHDRYGIPDANRFAYRLANGLWEFPLSTVRVGGRNLPVAGGGYFRLYPFWLTQRCIDRINGEGQPTIMYVHPWEVDPDQPRIDSASRATRFRHYVNIHKVLERLGRLCQRYEFAPVSQVFEGELALFEVEQTATNHQPANGLYYPDQEQPNLNQRNTAHADRNRNPRGTVLSPASTGQVVP